MEREIKVMVRVSNLAHAEKIRKDIEEVVEFRTPIFWIGDPEKSAMSIRKKHTVESVQVTSDLQKVEGEKDVKP